ncbi:MAG: hypothetical protein ACR2NF_00145, partial [Pirellulales bacterium]
CTVREVGSCPCAGIAHKARQHMNAGSEADSFGKAGFNKPNPGTFKIVVESNRYGCVRLIPNIVGTSA